MDDVVKIKKQTKATEKCDIKRKLNFENFTKLLRIKSVWEKNYLEKNKINTESLKKIINY